MEFVRPEGRGFAHPSSARRFACGSAFRGHHGRGGRGGHSGRRDHGPWSNSTHRGFGDHGWGRSRRAPILGRSPPARRPNCQVLHIQHCCRSCGHFGRLFSFWRRRSVDPRCWRAHCRCTGVGTTRRLTFRGLPHCYRSGQTGPSSCRPYGIGVGSVGKPVFSPSNLAGRCRPSSGHWFSTCQLPKLLLRLPWALWPKPVRLLALHRAQRQDPQSQKSKSLAPQRRST